MTRSGLILVIGWIALHAGHCLAQSATLQNEQIYFGDIATLLIEYDNKIPSLYALDTGELETDFEILDIRSRTARLSDAGEYTNRMQWEVRMLPRRSGRLSIPSLKLGELNTPALELEVLPLVSGLAARQSVEIELIAEPQAPLVGQQTNVTMRLVFNTPLLDLYWSEPSVAGADILRGIAESSYSRRRGEEYFDVVERVMAVFPRIQGKLDISPAALRAAIETETSGNSIERRQVYRNSAPMQIDVQNIPAAYSGRYWLPAREVSLTQRWEDAAEPLRVGDPIGRVLTIVARGLPAKSLPLGLLSDRTGAYAVYADQAALDQWVEGRDLVGRVEQTFALIANRPGEIRVPDLSLKWWDVDAGVERETRLPGRRFEVLPALPGDTGSAFSPLAGLRELRRFFVDGLAANPAWAFAFCVALVLLGLAWTRYAAPLRGWLLLRTRRLRAWRALRQSCRVADPMAARAALLRWAALRWPRHPCCGLLPVAARFRSSALQDEIRRLDRALYAAEPSDWDGAGLWRALRAAEAGGDSSVSSAPRGLAPLYPRTGN